jgi:hypothetical protein
VGALLVITEREGSVLPLLGVEPHSLERPNHSSAGFSSDLTSRSGFDPILVHKKFMLTTWHDIHVVLSPSTSGFPTVSFTPPVLHNHVSFLFYIHSILATESVVKYEDDYCCCCCCCCCYYYYYYYYYGMRAKFRDLAS